jgi:hypothetical protein
MGPAARDLACAVHLRSARADDDDAHTWIMELRDPRFPTLLSRWSLHALASSVSVAGLVRRAGHMSPHQLWLAGYDARRLSMVRRRRSICTRRVNVSHEFLGDWDSAALLCFACFGLGRWYNGWFPAGQEMCGREKCTHLSSTNDSVLCY